ncbi:MAG: MATE family efflux transporter [Oscillospiraceae bacterium]|jgi:putative MATE family efflux protein|nr:MATE family efflux transporter [Oscillospiraceae bacterium]
MKKYASLTEGRVASTLIRFSLPFLLAGFIQTAYASVDVYFVSHYAGAASVTGTFQGAMVMIIVAGIFMGLASGGTVLLGQYVGAKLDRDAARALGNIISVSVVSAAVICAVLLTFGRAIFSLINVPPEAMGEAWNYLSICTAGVVFTMGYNLISSVLRSLGDSKAPFVFILISCLTNVALDYVFVVVMGRGAGGAALATILAQALSCVLSLLYIRRKGLPFRFAFGDLRPERAMLLRIFKLGLPISAQGTLNNFSFLIISSITNSMGVNVAAATSVVNNLANLCMTIPMSFGSAVSAISAQNIGAGKPERAVRSMWIGVVISLGIAAICCAIANIWPKSVVRILTTDPGVVEESVRYLYPFAWDCLLVAFIFCMNGFFNGCGKTFFAMMHETSVAFFVRIPVTYVVKNYVSSATLFHIGVATPAASLVSLAACLIYYRLKFSGERLKKIGIVQ